MSVGRISKVVDIFFSQKKRRRRRRWSARQTGFKRGKRRGKEEEGQANTNFPRAVLKEKLLGGE